MSPRQIPTIILVVALAFGALTSSAAAATRFVSPAGSDEAGNDCLSAAAPCQTVHWGMDEAEAGDTVSIAAGTYREKFQVNKQLTLVGQGPLTLLEGEATVQRPVFVSADATFENLRIRGGLNESSAMDAVFIAGPAVEVVFDHVTAEQAPGATEGRNAVYVGEGSLTMKNSTITGVGSTALFVRDSATVIDSEVTVTPVNRGGEAVYADEGATVELIGSTIAHTGEKGQALMSSGGTVNAANSTFSGPKGIWASAGSASLTRDKIEASEVGLLQQNGATVDLRDALISPVPGGKTEDDILVNPSVATPATLTIVGSTLYAQESFSLSGPRAIEVGPQEGDVQARVVNSILRTIEPEGRNLDLAGEASWSVTHSDFTTKGAYGIPAPGTGTNVAAVPIFAGQPQGDYRLTSADTAFLGAGDPTQVEPGETDLAGQLRVFGGGCTGAAAPAIGAYELVRPERCPAPPAAGDRQGIPVPLEKESPSRPRITGVRLKKRSKGPILEFTLSESAKVTVTISKAITRGSGKRTQTRYRAVTKNSGEGAKGTHEILLRTLLGSRKLTPGAYRLVLIASTDGLKSVPRAVSLIEPGDS
jgi:hypothetical protein